MLKLTGKSLSLQVSVAGRPILFMSTGNLFTLPSIFSLRARHWAARRDSACALYVESGYIKRDREGGGENYLVGCVYVLCIHTAPSPCPHTPTTSLSSHSHTHIHLACMDCSLAPFPLPSLVLIVAAAVRAKLACCCCCCCFCQC